MLVPYFQCKRTRNRRKEKKAMLKIFYFKKDLVRECVKMHKKVGKILTDFEVNNILQNKLTKNQIFVIKKFLMKELGCLNGIVDSLKNSN